MTNPPGHGFRDLSLSNPGRGGRLFPLLYLCTLVLLHPLALGGADTPPAAQVAAKTLDILVLDDVSGAPLAGVGVMDNLDFVFGQGEEMMFKPRRWTDAQGRLRLEIPAAPAVLPYFAVSILSSNHPVLSVSWFTSNGGNVRGSIPASHTVRLVAPRVIGGWVRDSKGAPVPGATLVVWGYGDPFGAGPREGARPDESYTLIRSRHEAVKTDATGRWSFRRLPPAFRNVTIDVIRPGGDQVSFSTPRDNRFGLPAGSPVPLADLLATNAVLTLKDGRTVRGVVKDAGGRQIAGAIIQEQVGMDVSFLPAPVTNSADGRFELVDRSYSRALLRVHAPGFATLLRPIQPASEAGEIELRLQPAKPAVIRVLDASGAAMEGAGVSVAGHRSSVSVAWQSRTDSSGLAVWSNAPLTELVFWVTTSNRPMPRAVRWLPDGKERVVQFPSSNTNTAVQIRVRAVDDVSGQPISQFEVRRRPYVGSPFNTWGTGKDGLFAGELNPAEGVGGMEGSVLVDVIAPGRMPWKSPMLFADEGDQEIVARLAVAKPLAGTLRSPDGTPAGGAAMLVNTQDWPLYSWQPGVFQPAQGSTAVTTDAQGRFELPPQAEDRWVIITHASGFASIRTSLLQTNPSVALQAWGRVEGTLTVEGKPAASLQVAVRTPGNRLASGGHQAVYNQTTDKAGRFVFTNLPPGSFVWYRQLYTVNGAQVVESHPLPFDLKPGETKVLEFPRGGRMVSGSIEASQEVDWRNDIHVLELKLPPPPEEPGFVSYTSPKEFEEARRAYNTSEALLEYNRRIRQYQIEVDSSGFFKAADVPPGAYVMKLSVTRPPPRGQYRQHNAEVLGSLEKEVVIPPGEGPVDLGTFEMEIKGPEGSAGAPVEFTLTSPDGKPFGLSTLRGKPVVVTFWAGWALDGGQSLRVVDTSRKDLKSQAGVTFLAVNLDEDPAALASGAASVGPDWVQARLLGKSRLAAMEQLGMTTLPVTFILDPQGRVVARDVPAARLKSGLTRAQKSMAAR